MARRVAGAEPISGAPGPHGSSGESGMLREALVTCLERSPPGGGPLLAVACAAGAIAGLWLYKRATSGTIPRPSLLRRTLPGMAGALLLVLGWWATEARVRALDRDMRARLLHQATEIAGVIPIEQVASLSFTASDRGTPAFERTSAQLAAYAAYAGVRGIYSMAIRDGAIVFGPESYAPDDPMASPPGTFYEQPSPGDWEVFRTGGAQTIGPQTDEYGTFFSAVAPVREPVTGRVLMVIGLDVLADDWQARVAAGRVLPMLLTATVLLMLFGGVVSLQWRGRLPPEAQRRCRHLETGLAGGLGVVLTVSVTLLVLESESRERHAAFDSLAEARAERIRLGCRAVEADVVGLGRFVESSELVDRAEFAAFAAPSARSCALRALKWVPRVVAADRADFEAQARRDGVDELGIWERGAAGGRVRAGRRAEYFPARYVEPPPTGRDVLGFDHGADPRQRVTLEAAANAGWVTATPATAAEREAGAPVLVVMQPVFAGGRAGAGSGGAGARRPTGFAVGDVCVQALVDESRRPLASAAAETCLHLVELPAGEEPMWLARAPAGEPDRHVWLGRAAWQPVLAARSVHPIFAFGRAYALVIAPERAFYAARPLQATWLTGVGGTLFTVLLAGFVAVLRNRQVTLEHEVRLRTGELREREQNLAITLDSISDAVIATDIAGRVARMNPVAERLTGWSLAEAGGRPLSDVFRVVNAGTRAAVADPVVRVLARGDVAELANNTVLRARGGEEYRIENSAAPIRDVHGRVFGVVLVFHDVTERYRAQSALRESKERFDQIAEQSREIVWEVDADGCFTYVSHVAATVLGYRPDELVGCKHFYDLHPVAGRAAFRRRVLEAFARRAPLHELENAVRARDGQTLWFSTNGLPILDEQGRLLGYRGSHSDITERRRTEQALLEANRHLADASARATELAAQAREASAAKSEFLANMSHEIRTPMTAILGYVDLIGDSCPGRCEFADRQLPEAIGTIRRNGEHLLALLNDILDLSKIEAGKLETERIPCDPLQILADVDSLMRERAQAKRLALDFEFDGPLPRQIVTDPLRLRQILVNLVGNAVKFTERGGVRVVSRWLRRDEAAAAAAASAPDAGRPEREAPGARPGGFVPDLPERRAAREDALVFDVIDSGIGMTAAQRARVFEPFVQADSSTTRQFGGSGLGLPISVRLAAALGGGITVASQPGAGSCLTVTVAAGRVAEAGVVERPEQAFRVRPDGASPEAPPAPLNGRILLAEDGPDNQRLIGLLLEKAGAAVTVVENGRRAVEAALAARAAGAPFAVILMDMQMPELDGYEATRRLRAVGYAGPILALTAHAMSEDRAKCLAAGCDDYASKPIDRRRLVETIRRHMEGDPRAADAAGAGPAARAGAGSRDG